VSQFYFRPAHNEAQLIRGCALNAFDAAIVPASYLAPDPDDESSERDPRGLAAALKARGVPWVVDLGTPQLCHAKVLSAASCARLRETDFGRVLPLPLDPELLEEDEARNAFVDAAVAFQHGVPMLAAPYLELDGLVDPRLEVNLAMLRRVVGAAGDRLPVGFVQLTLSALNDGVAVRVAQRYAETKVTRVFLRVRNLRTEAATAKQLRNYLMAVDAFSDANVGVVCDPGGRFGAPAVAGGAIGFAAGSHFFRSVPRRIVSAGGGGGGPKLAVEIAGRYAALPRDLLGVEFDCPVSGCVVAAGARTTSALKEHNLHYLRYLGELAADLPAFIADLRRSGQPDALAWAEVLERRQRRSA
jgi:hypothetical protein